MTLKNTIKEFSEYLGDKESFIDKDHNNVAEKIKLFWGHEEFFGYMAQIVVVEKNRERHGFSYDVMLEIKKLQEIHEQIFPKIKPLSRRGHTIC